MTLVRDILVALSAVVVAVVGIRGLYTWRRALTGRAKFDIARNLMVLTFRLRDGFGWARHPLGSSIEWAERPRDENESPQVAKVLDERYGRLQRLQPVRDDLVKLEAAGWEAEAILSEDVSRTVGEVIGVFKRSYGELWAAIDSYFDQRRRLVETGTPSRPISEEQAEDLRTLGRLIFPTGDDDFASRIDDVVTRLGSTLRRYVR